MYVLSKPRRVGCLRARPGLKIHSAPRKDFHLLPTQLFDAALIPRTWKSSQHNKPQVFPNEKPTGTATVIKFLLIDPAKQRTRARSFKTAVAVAVAVAVASLLWRNNAHCVCGISLWNCSLPRNFAPSKRFLKYTPATTKDITIKETFL